MMKKLFYLLTILIMVSCSSQSEGVCICEQYVSLGGEITHTTHDFSGYGYSEEQCIGFGPANSTYVDGDNFNTVECTYN